MPISNSCKLQAEARDLKHRVLTCLHKLSDRDTHGAAASELESIAKTLSLDSLPPFLSSISATDSSDKSPVRRQCVRLISVLSEHHGNSLSPHLSKLLSAVARRLRDPDSSVRSACVAAALSIASRLTSPPFASIAKPFLESLFLEQDSNGQTGAALCLAAMIEGSRNPDAASLRKLLPRLEKLAKCEGFKAKAALLALIGSVVEVKGVLSSGVKNGVKNLITCLIEFLSNEDWAVRKAAAEAMMKLAAAAEKDALAGHKASCLKTFEAKRFDKVKAAREAMNQMIEAWKKIPDLPDEVFPSPGESQGSSKENASDGQYPYGLKTSVGHTSAPIKKSSPHDNAASRAPLSDSCPASTARRSSLGCNGSKTGPAMFRKLERKKPSSLKINSAAPASSGLVVYEVKPLDGNGRVLKKGEEESKQFPKPEIERALSCESHGKQKLGGGTFIVGDETGADICRRNQRDCEDLSPICKQLIQIENQQSNLLDLLQGFIESSQSGMQSLEARVHGLELALDAISYDLAVSNERPSANDAIRALCCRLPGANFLSSKLRRKTEIRSSASCETPSVAAVHNKKRGAEGFPFQNGRYILRGGNGLIMNPLAEIPGSSRGVSEPPSSEAAKNIA